MAYFNRNCIRLGCSSKGIIYCYRCIAPYCSQKCQQEDSHRHDAECTSIPSTISARYTDGSVKEVYFSPMDFAKIGGQILEELMRPRCDRPAAGRNEVMPHPQQNGQGVSVNGASSSGGLQVVAPGGPRMAACGGVAPRYPHQQAQPYNNVLFMRGRKPAQNTFTPRLSNPAPMQLYGKVRPPFSWGGWHGRGGQVQLRPPDTIRCMAPVAEKIRSMSSWLDFFSPGDEVSVYFTVNIKITGVNWCMLIPKNPAKRVELAEALSAAVDISGLELTQLSNCEPWDQIVMTENGVVLGRYIVIRLLMKVVVAHMDLGTLASCDQCMMVYVLPPERRMAPTVVPIHLTRDVNTMRNALIPNFDLRVEERGLLRTANGDRVNVYDWDFGFAFDKYHAPVAIPWPLPPVGPMGRATLLAVTRETQAVDGDVLIAFRLQSDEAELRVMENSLKEHQNLIWNRRSIVRFNDFGYTTDTIYVDCPRRFVVMGGNVGMIHVRYIDFAEEAHVNTELCALLPLCWARVSPFARYLRVDFASITEEEKLHLEGLAKQKGIVHVTVLKVNPEGPLEARLDLAENGGSFTGIIVQDNQKSVAEDLWADNGPPSGPPAVPNEASPANSPPAPSDALWFDSIRAPNHVPSFESPCALGDVGSLAPTADVVDETAGKMEDADPEPSVAEPGTKDAAEDAAPVAVDEPVVAVRPAWPTAVKYQKLKVGEEISVLITGVPRPRGTFPFDFAGHLKAKEPEYERLIAEMADRKFKNQHADYLPELHEIVRAFAMLDGEMEFVRAIYVGNQRYLSLDSGENLTRVSDVHPLPAALLASQPLINLFKFVDVGEGRDYVERLGRMGHYKMADAIVLLMVTNASKAPIYDVKLVGRILPE